MSDPLRVGVVGVGAMGANHARVYDELPGAELVGVADADSERADRVATKRDTDAPDVSTLLETVDAVSVAVPTHAHADVIDECIDAGVHALVEKPFVADPEEGRSLASRARRRGVTLQVGHVERFNPVVDVLGDVVADSDVVGLEARRLGPPVDRDGNDSVVVDLMIHDIDVVTSLVDAPVVGVSAEGTREGRHATATLRFGDDTVVTLTASRLTQRKIRRLDVIADDCFVTADYLDQSVDIYRRSIPEYVRNDGDVRYRHESVVERPMVQTGEPLKRELDSFLDAVREGTDPVVTPEQGIEALELARRIDSLASAREVRA